MFESVLLTFIKFFIGVATGMLLIGILFGG